VARPTVAQARPTAAWGPPLPTLTRSQPTTTSLIHGTRPGVAATAAVLVAALRIHDLEHPPVASLVDDFLRPVTLVGGHDLLDRRSRSW